MNVISSAHRAHVTWMGREQHNQAQEVTQWWERNYAAAFYLQCSSLVALPFTNKLAAVEKRFLDGHKIMFLEHI